MGSEKVFTREEVSQHNSREDVYLVIRGQVYDATPFINEHPGGDEVMLDCAGQDATTAFEDVGHSDEALEQLKKLRIGAYERKPGETDAPHAFAPSADRASSSANGSMGIGLYIGMVVVGVIGYFAYNYLQQQQQQQQMGASL